MWRHLSLIIVGCICVLTCTAQTASAKEIEVKSENFVFYGDISEKRAIEFVESLEAYRAILFSIYKINPGPEYIPVRIYGFNSQSRLEKVTGRDNIGGLYSTTLEGPVFLLSTAGGLKKGQAGLNIAYHEYTHHILSSFTDKLYPRWYNEGFAEYLSTFEFDKKGNFKIGLPSNHRGYALANSKWIPLETLTRSVRNYPFKKKGGQSNSRMQSLFYAQSWLVTHYINSTPGYSAKLTDYVERINQADAPVDAFEQAMGVSLEEFDAEVKRYFKKNTFTYVKTKIAANVSIPTASSRDLTKPELKYHQGEALRTLFKSEEGQALAKEYIAEAESAMGATAEILMSKAVWALENNDIENAKTLIAKAYELDPSSRHINRNFGIIEMETYRRLGANKGSLKSARKYLKFAMKAYPDDATAHYSYANSYSFGSETPNKQAMASAKSALSYFRSLDFLDTNMNMAEILVRGGEPESAVPVYEKVLLWGKKPSQRRYAEEKLKRIR